MNQPASIKREDFERWIEDWIDLSVKVTNHQPSGLKSREYDLRLCVDYRKRPVNPYVVGAG
jgi:hypothetical protein